MRDLHFQRIKLAEVRRNSVEGSNFNYYASSYSPLDKKLMFSNSALYCPECIDSIPPGSRGSSEFSNFNQIEIEGWMDVEIRYGRSFNVQKTGNTDLTRHVEISQSFETLYLSMNEDMALFRTKPRIIITMPQIYSIDIEGASSCDVGRFAGNRLKIECSGASNLQMELYYDELDVNLNGASHATLKGKTRRSSIEVNGASKLNALDLVTDIAELELGGASNCFLGISNSIKGKISGASMLEYSGSPNMEVQNNGLSKIHHREP